MPRLFRIVTAVVFAVHLVVGCCWHHAHACENNDDVQPAHGQCANNPDSGTDLANHGPHDCQRGKCSFVFSTSPVSNSFAQPFHTSVTLLLDDQHPLFGAGSGQHFFTTGWLLPPVRLHLANQVMLI
jgi:hypothetical protein